MGVTQDLAQMDASALRDLAAALISQIAEKDRTITLKQLRIDQLTYEMATLKRWRFAQPEERHIFAGP